MTVASTGECALRDLSLALWPGEVLGVAGVDGNGQKHLAEVLAGQRPIASGRMQIDGEDVTREGVAARRRRGLSYITDERLGEGTVGSMSVATNLVLKEIGRPPLWRNGVTLWDRIHDSAREQVARHDIRTPSERTPLGRLSGGNIQKVVLARELGEEARIAIFNKPTYGLDLQNTRLARQRSGTARRVEWRHWSSPPNLMSYSSFRTKSRCCSRGTSSAWSIISATLKGGSGA